MRRFAVVVCTLLVITAGAMFVTTRRSHAVTDSVWVEDSVPAGAITTGNGEAWNWISSNPWPYSGSLAQQSAVVAGMHQVYFYNATSTLSVSTGDRLFAYIYMDPAHVPSEIMLQWNDNGNWEHRAYWGSNQVGWGVDGTDSRRFMGYLPAAGSWARLEVPANQLGLEGHTVNGMAFTLYNGRATWDHAGRAPGGTCAPTVKTQIGNMSMRMSDGYKLYALSSLFNNGGYAYPTYTYGGNNTSIATFDLPTINGVNYFRIRAVGIGSTAGWLKITNPDGSATMNFSVNIADPPPEVKYPLTNNKVSVYIGGLQHVELNYELTNPGDGPNPIFSQPQGGLFINPDVSPGAPPDMNFTITTAPNSAIATGTVSTTCFFGFCTSRLDINGISVGSTTMAVKATQTDPPFGEGPVCTPSSPMVCPYSFTIQVLDDPPPYVVFPNIIQPHGSIESAKLKKSSMASFFNLPDVFKDPNPADSLTFDPAGPNPPPPPTISNPNIADVAITTDGQTSEIDNLRILPKNYGQANVTVYARDTHGHTTAYQFVLLVNDPPVPRPTGLEGEIFQGTTLKLDMSAPNKVVNVTSPALFTSPAGVSVTVTVDSNHPLINTHPEVAAVTYSSPNLTIDPLMVSATPTKVMIEACDFYGDCAALTFFVKVTSGDAPVVIGHINPKAFGAVEQDTLYLGMAEVYPVFTQGVQGLEFKPIDRMGTPPAPFYFSDSDPLTISLPSGVVASGFPYSFPTLITGPVARVQVFQPAGSTQWAMYVNHVAVGTQSITVQADDGHFNLTPYTFTAHVGNGHVPTISSSNPVPMTVNLKSGGPEMTYLAGDMFSDVDGDFLNLDTSYDVHVDNPNIATMSVHVPCCWSPQVMLLWITPGTTKGPTQGYVTAIDNAGNKVTYQFTIVVTNN